MLISIICPGSVNEFANVRWTLSVSNRINPEGYEVGYDIPAAIGMDEIEIQTPCLILDLDALERNIRKMGQLAADMGVRHRIHGKMHKSVDVAKLQEKLGGSRGVCCQKVAEAEAFVRGGTKDVLVSNEVRDPVEIEPYWLFRVDQFSMEFPDRFSTQLNTKGNRNECFLR